jgi:antitoxin (DNA-binding transcriptional repressor) of toxin-antitoxin stability system
MLAVTRRMCNMRSVTVQEVRQQFTRKVEEPLRRGETLILRKRQEVLGRIVPEPRRVEYPDFAARQRKIFGNRHPRLNVAEILRKDRSRF